MRKLVPRVVPVVVLASWCACAKPHDIVMITTTDPESPAAVSVRGRTSSGCTDAERVVLGNGVLPVENMMSPKGCLSEVAVFAVGHGMLMPVVTWKDQGGDRAQAAVSGGRLTLPVTGWIVHTSGESQNNIDDAKALLSRWSERAHQLFDAMQCGVRVSMKVGREIPVEDSSLLFADCDRAGDLKASGNYDSESANIYYVPFMAYNGEWCGTEKNGGQIGVVRSRALTETVAHELTARGVRRDKPAWSCE